ncbi:MAG: hypothetical protein U1A24_05705 [Cypionkella sp.]|uniref:hypothetical protein n=1 Tax=Cypionkella sp. TaxID=2811411 RepID=UPI002AB8CCE5|nr:hypothetical protein [Cypionkella sp.]MDZ4310035.1 hypothetical protein [Cypionkella sp.]MDZ4392643.1 hypothetical protein [Cypionkella sp.]
MNLWQIGVGAVMLGLGLAPNWAQAEQQTLFQHKNWMVAVNSFDDGGIACQAAVDEGSESFTIWVFQDQSVRLQFYSTDWNFTEGETADLQVEIDRRGEWSLSNATLTGNSALFDLPDSDKGVKLLVEIAQGRTAHLRDANGDAVRDYSLAGSKASMSALIECAEAIK